MHKKIELTKSKYCFFNNLAKLIIYKIKYWRKLILTIWPKCIKLLAYTCFMLRRAKMYQINSVYLFNNLVKMAKMYHWVISDFNIKI